MRHSCLERVFCIALSLRNLHLQPQKPRETVALILEFLQSLPNIQPEGCFAADGVSVVSFS
jgi:hypothetical protein